MEKTIKRAIEGGYDKLKTMPPQINGDAVILLDPLFWQALGKACGWNEKHEKLGIIPITTEPWVYEWHRFIDKIASGGTPDDFFNELLGGTDL